MQAYEFMLAGQLPRAHAPLEQAYKARPLAQQPRPLILNRAMLDITQKVNIMRPVKDLRDYLANLPPGQVDEDAVDLLGAALQIASKNPRLAELPLSAAGQKQLQNSIGLLEQARPHERKWGQKWYREVDFRHIQFTVDRATRLYNFEQEQAERQRVDLEVARADAARYNTLNTVIGHRHANPIDAYNCPTCQANRLHVAKADSAQKRVLTAEGDYKVQKLKADKAKAEIPQPDWMAVAFRPFHPNAPANAVAAEPRPAEPPSLEIPAEMQLPAGAAPAQVPAGAPTAAPPPTSPASRELFGDPTPAQAPAPAPAPAADRSSDPFQRTRTQ